MKTPAGSQLQRLTTEIDQIPETRGAGIAFIGDNRCVELRGAQHTSGMETYVILQEEVIEGPPGDVPIPNIRIELVGLGLNCGGAMLSWAALVGEGIAAPFSGGASLGLTLLTWGAAMATSTQCLTSIIRSTDLTFNEGS
jgi:hypothetical protein